MNKVRLDPEATSAGLRERLFLHETITPAFSGYDRNESLEAMWLIRQIIANRVAHPRIFGLRAPQTEASIITDPRQFPGFEGYPHLAAASMRNVYSVEMLANADGDRRQPNYRQHLLDAITVATAPNVPANMVVSGVAAWKRRNTPSPGAKFSYYKTLQQNDFYTTSLTAT